MKLPTDNAEYIDTYYQYDHNRYELRAHIELKMHNELVAATLVSAIIPNSDCERDYKDVLFDYIMILEKLNKGEL
jgi:hypothetical protein